MRRLLLLLLLLGWTRLSSLLLLLLLLLDLLLHLAHLCYLFRRGLASLLLLLLHLLLQLAHLCYLLRRRLHLGLLLRHGRFSHLLDVLRHRHAVPLCFGLELLLHCADLLGRGLLHTRRGAALGHWAGHRGTSVFALCETVILRAGIEARIGGLSREFGS